MLPLQEKKKKPKTVREGNLHSQICKNFLFQRSPENLKAKIAATLQMFRDETLIQTFISQLQLCHVGEASKQPHRILESLFNENTTRRYKGSEGCLVYWLQSNFLQLQSLKLEMLHSNTVYISAHTHI